MYDTVYKTWYAVSALTQLTCSDFGHQFVTVFIFFSFLQAETASGYLLLAP